MDMLLICFPLQVIDSSGKCPGRGSDIGCGRGSVVGGKGGGGCDVTGGS